MGIHSKETFEREATTNLGNKARDTGQKFGSVLLDLSRDTYVKGTRVLRKSNFIEVCMELELSFTKEEVAELHKSSNRGKIGIIGLPEHRFLKQRQNT